MTYKSGLFKDWVPKALGLFSLFLVLVPLLVINGVYVSNIADIVGAFGIQSENIQYANYASFAGMVIAFPIVLRIKGIMKSRNILLMSLFVQIALCI